MKLRRDDSLLLLIDLQGRLTPAIRGIDAILERSLVLVEAARRLGVPILATEQNPRGLGPTVPEIAKWLSDEEVVSKMHFDAMDDPAVAARLGAKGRGQVVVAGCEAHVCVLQTLFSLKQAGYSPAVVADAVGSRRDRDWDLALVRLNGWGIPSLTSEMIVFEWLERCDTPDFKAVLPLIR